MAFKLPELPYDYDALEPHISADTLRYHHDKHHKAYVDKLNAAVEGSPLEKMRLEEVIQEVSDDPERKGVFNNAAQVWNHSFYWQCMSPSGGGEPAGELARAIDEAFGGFEKFREAFVNAAAGQFGSGWAWLVLDGGKLRVTSTPNAVPPMVSGHQALLTCDVWEHAYYLDYQNERPKYLSAFFDKLINWAFVAEQFALQGEGNRVAARRYRDDQEAYAASGKAKVVGKEARETLESDEGAELEQARRRAAGA